MPDGVSLGTIAAVLIPVGIVTVLLRELPFSAKKWMKDSEFFSLLGLMMPVGVMTILVVYAVAGQADGTGGLWPVLLGVLGHRRAAQMEAGFRTIHLRRNRVLHDPGEPGAVGRA